MLRCRGDNSLVMSDKKLTQEIIEIIIGIDSPKLILIGISVFGTLRFALTKS